MSTELEEIARRAAEEISEFYEQYGLMPHKLTMANIILSACKDAAAVKEDTLKRIADLTKPWEEYGQWFFASTVHKEIHELATAEEDSVK